MTLTKDGKPAMQVTQAQMVFGGDKDALSAEESVGDSIHRKCKIICTMGPACWDVDMLVKLIDAGMNVCRLNFSHGDHEGHASTIKRIKEASAKRPDKPVAILLDTKGPEIRTGFFREDVGKSIELKAGQDLKLVIDYSFKGDSTCFALSYDQLCKSVKPGNLILCADGSLTLKVKSVADDHVITEVLNNCKMGERKNCNLPGVKVELPVLQAKDIDDLVNFGIPQNVDFVAASFVQNAADVKMIRDTLGEAGKHIHIISKIENEEGLKNFHEICEASDGIMVARGDLGMEIPPEKVFLAQKMMIGICNTKGKPVVTATQMLESMINLPRPTRAEASDVANAVLDGTDCVMLSGETANGAFPENAVSIMRNVCLEAESALDYSALFLSTRAKTLAKAQGALHPIESLCSSAVETAMDVGANVIVCLTQSGATAQTLAKYRPNAQILAVTTQQKTVSHLNVVRGVVPVLINSFSEEPVNQAFYWTKLHGIAKAGETAVVVHGVVSEDGQRGPLLPGSGDVKGGAAVMSNVALVTTIPA